MKWRFAAPAVLFLCVVAVAADQSSVAGKWQIHSTVAGTEYDITCTFAQKDADLTGTCDTDQGSKDLTGKVDADKITWSYKSEYNGTPLTVNHEGTLKDDKISGTVDVPEFSVTGDFAATRAKEEKK